MKRVLFFLSVLPIFIFLWGVLPSGDVGGSEGIVGAEICKGCHDDHYQSYLKSTHAKKGIPNSPARKDACESCHGPGAAHVEKSGEKGVGIFIFSKKIADAKSKSAKCFSCHGDSRDLSFWDLSKHKVFDVSCDNCHTVHSGTRKNLKATQPDLCNICHRSIRAQQNKQSHHPIREGKLKCTDCHDHHGGFGPKMVKANSFNDLCYQCHAEKRGPYMWQHPPVEENCLSCHTSHGSNHSKLLISKVPQLCQSCHDWTQHPGTPYSKFETFQGTATSGKNRMFSRSCLNCHSNVHGSNAPASRGITHVR
ncbi:MAG: DmsE family decaheme c-type cytochrome [Deltaproteobacteria bacterium]|nr:MAG: DmsE family decaheme c-type cytochrome [Deltaproteobacteria bacterium]